jgi:nitroimidazol reductase NimA-like FMN-containing flavoprotein (pyridoxamine 5'-phosphate oxidase superfamily)
LKTKSNVRNLTKEETVDFLKSQQVGTLSLNDRKSSYAVPLAYFFDADTVFLTLGPEARKHNYVKANQNICFSVFEVKPGVAGAMSMCWKSAICDGKLERITDPELLTRTVRLGEKAMGMPEGTWQKLLEITLKNPSISNFWKIKTASIGGRGVEGFKEEFEKG